MTCYMSYMEQGHLRTVLGPGKQASPQRPLRLSIASNPLTHPLKIKTKTPGGWAVALLHGCAKVYSRPCSHLPSSYGPCYMLL
jgi:hypothetical protein